ncbi:hypothetical protein G6F40_013465 [Rhizopus arrhizus]|nr:hypothetical protein G6F40_013465 [Rhizopus arrhizus]
MGIAAFQQADPAALQQFVIARLGAFAAPDADAVGDGQQPRQQAQADVQHDEGRDDQQDRQRQRHPDAPGPDQQQHVAGMGAQHHRQSDGDDGKQQSPEPGSHGVQAVGHFRHAHGDVGMRQFARQRLGGDGVGGAVVEVLGQRDADVVERALPDGGLAHQHGQLDGQQALAQRAAHLVGLFGRQQQGGRLVHALDGDQAAQFLRQAFAFAGRRQDGHAVSVGRQLARRRGAHAATARRHDCYLFRAHACSFSVLSRKRPL